MKCTYIWHRQLHNSILFTYKIKIEYILKQSLHQLYSGADKHQVFYYYIQNNFRPKGIYFHYNISEEAVCYFYSFCLKFLYLFQNNNLCLLFHFQSQRTLKLQMEHPVWWILNTLTINTLSICFDIWIHRSNTN